VTYLDSILLERTLPCLAESGKIVVFGKPNRSLSDVIPYLASLPGVISFNPETLMLSFRRQPGYLTLTPDQVYITQVLNAEEGLQLLIALQEAVNAVWREREQLTPVTTRHQAARPLDVWALLPQTNCRKCGEATCMASAILLIQGIRFLEECPVLIDDPVLANQRTTLEAIIPS
jgi:ArsR family metal-binding transcriptional regulator